MNRIFLLLILILGISGCQEENKISNTLPKSEQEAYNIIFDLKRFSRREIEIKATEISLRNDTTYVFDFMITFFDDEGNKTSELYADSGFVIEERGIMSAYGDIKVISTTGDSLHASTLRWEENKNLIYSNHPVILFKKDKIIRAQGLEADPALRHIVLKGKVYGEDQQ